MMKKIIYITVLALIISTGTNAQTTVNSSVTNNKNIIITNFTVYAKDAKIVIEWATDAAAATNYWEVQRSTDGTQFSAIALVLGADPRQEGDRYQYMEKLKDTKNATAYYRLRHIGADGKEQLSNIIQPAK
jgi:trimeric autotransporter adhesin